MKPTPGLTEAEEKLAAIVWREANLTSSLLVKLAESELIWNRSSTFTILRKLCEKGVCKNENTKITVLRTREEQTDWQSRRYVEDTFGGSLPRFITSFFGNRKLTPEQADELRQLIDEREERATNG